MSCREENVRFLICPGAPRCGTTFLDSILREQNEFFTPKFEKEINFFNQKFDFRRLKNHYGDIDFKKNSYLIDFTTDYLADRKALSYIENFKGHYKVIIMVRRPIDRISSMLKLNRFYGYKMTEVINLSANEWLKNFLFLQEHVETWIKVLGKDNVHIFDFNDLKNNSFLFLIRISEELGIKIDPTVISHQKANRHQSLKPRSNNIARLISRLNVFFRKNHLNFISDYFKNSKLIKSVFFKTYNNQEEKYYKEISRKILSQNLNRLDEEINFFEKILNKKLDSWKLQNKY